MPDWSKFPSSMPLQGVAYPKGKEKADMVARVRRAFANLKGDQAIGG